jgi:hypothetical protein
MLKVDEIIRARLKEGVWQIKVHLLAGIQSERVGVGTGMAVHGPTTIAHSLLMRIPHE